MLRNPFSWHRGVDLPECGPIKLVVIQASPFCNLDCDYCYLPHRLSSERLSLDLLTPIFLKLFASPFFAEDVTIVWHAGEPLAVPQTFYAEAFELRFKGQRCKGGAILCTIGLLQFCQ